MLRHAFDLLLIVLLVAAGFEIRDTRDQVADLKAANAEHLYRVVELQGVLSDLLAQPVTFSTRCEDLQVTATAYSASVAETDDRPWETANGSLATVGRIAVSRDLEVGYGLRPGSTVALAGLGLVRIEDRMAARHSRSIDLLLAHPEAAERFGRRNVTLIWCR